MAIAVSGSGDAVALSDGSDLQTVRFGADGGLAATTTLRPATSGKAIARGPSGQLFVAGVPTEPAVASPVVARLDGDRVDLSWGSDGWATLPVMVAEQTSLLIAADERGRLVAAVRSSPGFAVGRLTSKGQPDPCFGHQGVADGYGGDGLAVQANGKIVLAADVYPSGALFRLNADGDYDTGFKPPPIYLAFPRAAPDMSLTVLGGGEIIARTRHNVLVRLHP